MVTDHPGRHQIAAGIADGDLDAGRQARRRQLRPRIFVDRIGGFSEAISSQRLGSLVFDAERTPHEHWIVSELAALLGNGQQILAQAPSVCQEEGCLTKSSDSRCVFRKLALV